MAFEGLSNFSGPFNVSLLNYNETWQTWADYSGDGQIQYEEWMYMKVDL